MRRNLYCYGYIFLITNLINSKKFVGRSICSISQTVKRILRNVKNPTTSEYTSQLGQDIRKYGSENFEIEILEEIYLKGDETPLNTKVIYYRKKLDTVENGYNESYSNSSVLKAKDQVSKYAIPDEDKKHKIISMFLNGYSIKDIRKELSTTFYVVDNVLTEACLIPYSISYLNSQQIVCTSNYSFSSQFNGIDSAANAMYGSSYYKRDIKNLVNSNSDCDGIRYDVIDVSKTPKNCPLVFIKRRDI